MEATETIEDKIARDLEEDIIFGRLQPGARLREDALLERFGGTRHLIRAALAKLGQTGIVVIERNRGAAVRRFEPDQVMQVYEVREMLLRQAALKIPLPADPSVIKHLTEINSNYRHCIANNNQRGIHELNDLFHNVLMSACPNTYLRDLVQKYTDLTLAIRAANLANPELLKASFEHHQLMIQYLQGTDNWLLAELCAVHVRASKELYLKTSVPEKKQKRK